jgi:D-glycero-D-manno-heptose 1,7-bisphosphate phosphatase
MLRFVHHALPVSKNPEENRVIFIDRDGVINIDPIGDYIKSWKDFQFEPGALEALRLLTQREYHIIVISNQAGIGDGLYTEAALRDIHRNMVVEFEKNGISIRSAHYCMHGKEAGCKCRKPEIGLFEDAARGLPFVKEKTYFIGDKKTDMEAGKRFGIKTIFVRTGHGKTDEAKLTKTSKPDILADNLLQAVQNLKNS